MIGGGEGAVNATLEATSGDTVTLTCSLDQVGNDTVTFSWSRQDGRALPQQSCHNEGKEDWNGVWMCAYIMILMDVQLLL